MTHFELIVNTTKANIEIYHNCSLTFSSTKDEALHYKLRAVGAYELAHDLLIECGAYDEKNEFSEWFYNVYCKKFDDFINSLND